MCLFKYKLISSMFTVFIYKLYIQVSEFWKWKAPCLRDEQLSECKAILGAQCYLLRPKNRKQKPHHLTQKAGMPGNREIRIKFQKLSCPLSDKVAKRQCVSLIKSPVGCQESSGGRSSTAGDLYMGEEREQPPAPFQQAVLSSVRRLAEYRLAPIYLWAAKRVP